MNFDYLNDWLIFKRDDIKNSADMESLNRLLEAMMNVHCCEVSEPAGDILDSLNVSAAHVGVTVATGPQGDDAFIIFGAATRQKMMQHVESQPSKVERMLGHRKLRAVS